MPKNDEKVPQDDFSESFFKSFIGIRLRELMEYSDENKQLCQNYFESEKKRFFQLEDLKVAAKKEKTPQGFITLAKTAMTLVPPETQMAAQFCVEASEMSVKSLMNVVDVKMAGSDNFDYFCHILTNIDSDKKEDILAGWINCNKARREPFSFGVDDNDYHEIEEIAENFVKDISSLDKRMVMASLVEISNFLKNKKRRGKVVRNMMKDHFGKIVLANLKPKEFFKNGTGPVLMIKIIYSEDCEILRQEYLSDRRKCVEILKKLLVLDGEQIDEKSFPECKDLLVMIFGDVPVEELLSKYQILLLQAIRNSPSNVVDVLANILQKNSSSVSLLESSAFEVALAFTGRLNEQECFESSSKLLGPLASNDLVVKELESQMSKLGGDMNTFQRFQRYQLLLEAFKTESYQENLKFLLESLAEDATNSKVQKNQLSALKLLSDCVIANEFSARILNEMEISKKIYDIWNRSRLIFSSDGAVLVFACIRFFGHLTRQHPEAIDAFPDYIPFVANLTINFDLFDASQRILAFDTFSNICYSNLAKEKIENVLKGSLSKVLGSFGAAINHGPAEMRIRHVEAASLMFENATDDIAYRWFEQFGQGSSFISTIVTSIQKPFIDIRSAFFKLLLVVFEYPKILIEFVRFSGFNEWLLNEESEMEYETTQLKKQVIRKMIVKGEEDSKKEERLLNFDGPYVLQLTGYLLPNAAQPIERAL